MIDGDRIIKIFKFISLILRMAIMSLSREKILFITENYSPMYRKGSLINNSYCKNMIVTRVEMSNPTPNSPVLYWKIYGKRNWIK